MKQNEMKLKKKSFKRGGNNKQNEKNYHDQIFQLSLLGDENFIKTLKRKNKIYKYKKSNDLPNRQNWEITNRKNEVVQK